MADSNELKLLLKIEGVETLGKLKTAVKEAKKELATIPVESERFKELSKEISITGTRIGKLSEGTLTANGRMMQSYFKLGQRLRATALSGGGFESILQKLVITITVMQGKGQSLGAVFGGLIRSAFTPLSVAIIAVTAGLALYNKVIDANAEKTKKVAETAKTLKGLLQDIKALTYELSGDLVGQVIAKKAEATAKQSSFRSGMLPQRNALGMIMTAQDTPEQSAQKLKDLRQAQVELKNLTAKLGETLTEPYEKEKIARHKAGMEGNEIDAEFAKKRREVAKKDMKDREDDAIKQQKESLDERAKDYKDFVDRKDKEEQEFADAERKRLRDLHENYNSMFFDPLKAGFQDLSRQIFGTESRVKALRQTFGSVGAAIIQSLEGVISKLAEVALMSMVLEMLSMGSGTFSKTFMSIINPAKKASGGTLGDGMTLVGEQGAEMIYKRGSSAFVYNNSQTAGMGIASASRSKAQGMQSVHITGTFRQVGSDLVAVVENSQLKRSTRSASIAGR